MAGIFSHQGSVCRYLHTITVQSCHLVFPLQHFRMKWTSMSDMKCDSEKVCQFWTSQSSPCQCIHVKRHRNSIRFLNWMLRISHRYHRRIGNNWRLFRLTWRSSGKLSYSRGGQWFIAARKKLIPVIPEGILIEIKLRVAPFPLLFREGVCWKSLTIYWWWQKALYSRHHLRLTRNYCSNFRRPAGPRSA